MNRLYRRLTVALARRDRGALSDLVRQHPDAHDGCDRRDTPVAMVAAAGLDLLEVAFAAGLSPDAGHRADAVQTFLQRAAAEGDVETVALCIRYGADLERRNASDETALGYACSWGRLPVVRLLVEAGADVNAIERDPEHGIPNTALDCCGEHPAIAEYLESVGARSITDIEPGP
jgi:ankyrin repeat protein